MTKSSKKRMNKAQKKRTKKFIQQIKLQLKGNKSETITHMLNDWANTPDLMFAEFNDWAELGEEIEGYYFDEFIKLLEVGLQEFFKDNPDADGNMLTAVFTKIAQKAAITANKKTLDINWKDDKIV